MKEVRFFYVPDAATQTELPQEEATHALRVLRIQAAVSYTHLTLPTKA